MTPSNTVIQKRYWRSANRILSDPKTLLTRGAEKPFTCFDLLIIFFAAVGRRKSSRPESWPKGSPAKIQGPDHQVYTISKVEGTRCWCHLNVGVNINGRLHVGFVIKFSQTSHQGLIGRPFLPLFHGNHFTKSNQVGNPRTRLMVLTQYLYSLVVKGAETLSIRINHMSVPSTMRS